MRLHPGRRRDGEASVIVVRPVRAGDREALAALYADLGDYYADLAPDDFKRPDLRAFDPPLEMPGHFVAELEGEVIAVVVAVVLEPEDEHGIDPGLAVRRLRIDFLATLSGHRRTGAGRALVEAAEAWGREQGARVAETWTYGKSPLSMPFWTEGAGYEPRSVILRKRL